MEGAPGDIILVIQQAPHHTFNRIGDELHTNIYISLQEVILFKIYRHYLDSKGQLHSWMEGKL